MTRMALPPLPAFVNSLFYGKFAVISIHFFPFAAHFAQNQPHQQDRKQDYGVGGTVTLTGQEAGVAREALEAMAVEPVSAGDGSVTYDLTREQAAALGETVEALHDIDGGVTLILEVAE